jgi:hypothetical protein
LIVARNRAGKLVKKVIAGASYRPLNRL